VSSEKSAAKQQLWLMSVDIERYAEGAKRNRSAVACVSLLWTHCWNS